MALGPMTAPVMLHPPPSTKSLPSATWAASHKSMVTRTAVKLPGAPDTSSPVPPDVGSQPMTTPTDGLALPSTERPEPVTPRTRRRRWSLRAHLIAVVLVTIVDVVLPDGSVLCSSDKAQVQPGQRPHANAGWLTPVIQKGSATILGPLRDPVSNKWALYIAAPIPAPNSQPSATSPGALAVVLDLAPVAPALQRGIGSDRYTGAALEYLITTAKRDRVVSRSIQPDRSVAKPLDASQEARADSSKGALIPDLDGTERLYVGQTVDELKWHVYAGISKKAVYQPARAALHDYIPSGLITLIGLALVALAGIFTVARR